MTPPPDQPAASTNDRHEAFTLTAISNLRERLSHPIGGHGLTVDNVWVADLRWVLDELDKLRLTPDRPKGGGEEVDISKYLTRSEKIKREIGELFAPPAPPDAPPPSAPRSLRGDEAELFARCYEYMIGRCIAQPWGEHSGRLTDDEERQLGRDMAAYRYRRLVEPSPASAGRGAYGEDARYGLVSVDQVKANAKMYRETFRESSNEPTHLPAPSPVSAARGPEEAKDVVQKLADALAAYINADDWTESLQENAISAYAAFMQPAPSLPVAPGVDVLRQDHDFNERQLLAANEMIRAKDAEIARLNALIQGKDSALQGVIDTAAHPDIALRSVMVDLKPVRAALAKDANATLKEIAEDAK